MSFPLAHSRACRVHTLRQFPLGVHPIGLPNHCQCSDKCHGNSLRFDGQYVKAAEIEALVHGLVRSIRAYQGSIHCRKLTRNARVETPGCFQSAPGALPAAHAVDTTVRRQRRRAMRGRKACSCTAAPPPSPCSPSHHRKMRANCFVLQMGSLGAAAPDHHPRQL